MSLAVEAPTFPKDTQDKEKQVVAPDQNAW
jgi:hypothetical protein